ncbi:MAG TPA: alpha/beta hydrolase [Polyangiaceae bacterium]|nr:alpha/beta hydrolase [Polyangiaceae bacterium]
MVARVKEAHMHVMHDTTAIPSSTRVPSEAELKRAFRSAPHRYLDIGHSRLAYWRYGSGPDVVFVHGWPLDAATFRRIVPALAKDFTCHLLDLPGVGQSISSEDAPLDFLSHPKSLRQAIDVLGLTSFAYLAHDSGAFVARLAAAGDRRVRALVLSGTEIPGYTPPLLLAYIFLARSRLGTRLLRATMRTRFLRRSPLAFGACFEKPAYVDGDFHELFVAPLVESDEVAEAQLAPLRKLNQNVLDHLPAAHRAIDVPVQLIWGSRDPFFPIERARKMEFAGPVSFVEVPRAKLFVHEDRAEEFADHARSFLRSKLYS